MRKTCELCGKKFETPRWNKRFCGTYLYKIGCSYIKYRERTKRKNDKYLKKRKEYIRSLEEKVRLLTNLSSEE